MVPDTKVKFRLLTPLTRVYTIGAFWLSVSLRSLHTLHPNPLQM